eukprot:TRINITY_DN2099_c0_g1_i1.p1 TRINITY_DN2099_c0_g1~~TRINITY_DN2099_c0_g1_i1.p1  ORF type:complete len:235 (-),score=9.29 TRINITY_DN2099_c0_g1_i1:82-786(-)
MCHIHLDRGCQHCLGVTGNAFWFIFSGWIFGILYFMFGILFCCTIFGFMYGLRLISFSRYVLFPFGKSVYRTIPQHSCERCYTDSMTFLWWIIGGLWLSIFHILFGIVFGITLIGIPLAKKHFRLAVLIFRPFNLEFCDGHYHGEHHVEVHCDDVEYVTIHETHHQHQVQGPQVVVTNPVQSQVIYPQPVPVQYVSVTQPNPYVQSMPYQTQVVYQQPAPQHIYSTPAPVVTYT